MENSLALIVGGRTANFAEPINLDELQDYDIIIDPCIEIEPRVFLNKQEIWLEKIWKKEKPGYKFKAKHRFEEIGVQTIRVQTDGKSVSQKVRIRPTKISQEDYEESLRQIQEIAYNIIYEVFGRTEEEVRLRRLQAPKSPAEFFSYFEKNFAQFKNIFRRIQKDPNVAIKERLRETRFFEADHFEEVIEYERPEKRLVSLQDRLNGLLPKIVATSEGFLSFDVYENRLLKHYLGLVVNKLNFLKEVAINEIKRESQNQEIYGGDPSSDARFQEKIERWTQIVQKCDNNRRDANRMRTSSFLDDVSKLGLVKTSMVLQKEPRYKAFYELYRDFRKNSVIEIHSDYFHLPVTDLWRTYEIWVLLKVYEALRNIGFVTRNQGLVDVDARYICDAKKVRFNFDLTKNKSLLEMDKKGRTVKVYYQREYQTNFDDYGSTYETAQRPDIALEIFEAGAAIPEIIILDPKYRIEGDKPPQAAIHELSHYKNTIRDKQDRRIVKNAYAVYPGKTTESFGKNRDYGYIGLIPTSDMSQFEQKILEMIS